MPITGAINKIATKRNAFTIYSVSPRDWTPPRDWTLSGFAPNRATVLPILAVPVGLFSLLYITFYNQWLLVDVLNPFEDDILSMLMKRRT
jgi:hypothetical protein